jgi:hypothetical protein
LKKMIETERLILRQVDPVLDFEGWAAAFGDPETVKYLGLEPMARPQAWRSMAVIIGHWAIRGYGFSRSSKKPVENGLAASVTGTPKAGRK